MTTEAMTGQAKPTAVTSTEAINTNAREASLRPFGKPSRLWWLTILALSLVVLTGIAAWVIQLRGGMGVAGYSDQAFWAIYIADVVTFIGVSYGGAVVSAILRLTGATWRAPLTRLAEGTAVVTVLIGAALIIPHIGNPIRLWELVTRPNLSAPVFWDFVAVMTYTFGSIVFFALPLVPDMAVLGQEHGEQLGRRRATLYARVSRGWVGAPKQRRVLAGALGLVSIMIIPLAVSVHSVLAWAFASTARPWWHESIWAPQFVVAALYSGVALVILVVAGFRRGYHLQGLITARHFVRLGFIMATLSATYIYLTFADLLPGSYVGDRGTAAVFTELLVGRLAIWFWLFAIVGGALPLLLVALPWTRNVGGMVTAAILVVPMMWLKRILMVVGPATYDTMTGAFGRYHFTWVPVAITLAATAAIPLLLMLLFRVVPLLSIDEIEEMEQMQELSDLQASATALPKATSESAVHQDRVVGATSTAHRVAGATGVLMLVALMGVLGVASADHSQAATPQSGALQSGAPSAPNVTLTGVETSGSVQLSATIKSPAGVPVPKAAVTFLLSTTEFGTPARLVPLGSATTDNTGVATLKFAPRVTGNQGFTATYTGAGAKPVTSSTAVVAVTVAQSLYHPAPAKPLASVGDVLVLALFAIVAAIWLTLATQIWRVRRVCRSAGQVTPSTT
ncbi:MAG TPA: NrfD/PsrC family molybdoenzyme membrane anchor subunit [Dermatophilaceae bacterium]|nr:NrfD/PsrC family molybdoenzyme membrane anchor subunit [Dermatophilaceae bacterium]